MSIDQSQHKNNETDTKATDVKPNTHSFKIDMTLSINDVRKQALLLYGSVTGFSKQLGITHAQGSGLLSGKYIPLKPSSIQKISDVLHINPIILTQIYDELKFKKREVENGN